MTIKLRYDQIEQHNPWASQRGRYRWDLVPTGRDVEVDLSAENRADAYDFRDRLSVVKDKAYRIRAAAKGRATAAGLRLTCSVKKPYDVVTLRFDQP